MTHKNAPPETDEQIRMREFYKARGVVCGWSRDEDGRYHARFANDAWAAWQAAQGTGRKLLADALPLLVEAHSEAREGFQRGHLAVVIMWTKNYLHLD